MRQYFRSLFDFRREELPQLIPLFLDYFLLIFAAYVLKSAASALFLNRLGVEKLPYTYILTAISAGAVAYFLGHLSARTSMTRLIQTTRWFVIGNIVVLWCLIEFTRWVWPYYAFLVWVKIYPILTITQYWILANNSFDSRQAKRLFGLLNLGGVLGAMLAGAFTMFFVHALLAENLLLIAAAVLTFSSGAFELAVRRAPAVKEAGAVREFKGFRALEMVRMAVRDRHLLAISTMISVAVIVGKLVEYQFFGIAHATYPDKEDLTAFLGGFLGLYMSAIALAIQVFITGAVLRVYGVGGALRLTPAAVAIGAAGVLAWPGLVMASALRGIEAGCRVTLNKTSLEVLYLPIPPEIKNRTRIFIDSVVDGLSDGLAGLLLVFCTSGLLLSLREISIVTIVFAILWIVLGGFAFRAYVATIRNSLAKRTIHLEDAAVEVSDAATIAVLAQALNSSSERQITYALQLLQQAPQAPLGGRLTVLLEHPSTQIKTAALRLLSSRGDPSALQAGAPLVTHANEEVRAEAVHYLCRCDSDANSKLQEHVNHPELEVRLAAMLAAKQYDYPRPIPAVSASWIQDLLHRPAPEAIKARTLVARSLPLADPRAVPVRDLLSRLLNDSEPLVVKEALQAAGIIQDQELVPLLIGKLEKRATRGEARDALVAYGTRIVDMLRRSLSDSSVPEAARLAIPRLLGQIGTSDAAGILVSGLRHGAFEMRYQILKALNRIRREHPEVSIPEEVIDREILEEAKHYYLLLNSLQSDPDGSRPGRELLIRTLEERLDQTLDRIFRMLGLRYPPKEVYDAYHEVKSLRSTRRAGALEFLDNALDRSHKRILLPLLEEVSWERLKPLGKEIYGLEPLNTEQCLRELIRSDDRWVKMVAIYRAAELGLRTLAPEMRDARNDSDPSVAETAALALSRIVPQPG